MKKEAKYWLIFGFVIFLIEYPVLSMYRRSFVIKTYFDLFKMVLDSFPRFHLARRISIELVVLNGMHWERARRAGREKRGATAHF